MGFTGRNIVDQYLSPATSGRYPKAKDALRWAAYTYVVAALGSLATLLYYIMIYLGRRN